MNPKVVNKALNRALTILYRSLPMYLSDATPWTNAHDARATEVMENILTDQKVTAGRIGQLLADRRARTEIGPFPLEYTDLNFLGLDFLVPEMIRWQHLDIATLEECVEQVKGDRQAAAILQEVVGSERAHLDALVELTHQPV